jgi:polyisoprenoid-binding protein YceI
MTTATQPFAGTYAADPVHSSFGFAVRYQGVSLFKGTLSEVDATLVDGKLEGVAKVESISIRTPEQFRAHVLSAEFFDAENHPEVKFAFLGHRSRRRRHRQGAGRADDQGHHPPRRRPPAPGSLRAPTPSAPPAGTSTSRRQIDRTEWDMNWNMALPSGGNVLANEVTLTVELSLVEQA